MSIVREFGLPVYRWWTQSQREVFARRFQAARQWPAAIIFYHRVADDHPNPWTIDAKRFSEQLDFIESIAKFASLNEIRGDQIKKVRDRMKVAVTFDDGYGDNISWVLPELVRRRIPCTYFVTTDYVESGQPFPHDAARQCPLRPNTKEEIQAIAKAGIEIGGHTRSHLDLGQSWPLENLRSEIADSRKRLQDWTGQSIDYFAFPYGLIKNFTQAAIDVVADAGYRAFVSAFGGWNYPGGDDFHLKRFHGDPCTEAIRNWLTFDPRWMRDVEELIYQKPTRTDSNFETQLWLETPKTSQASQAIPTYSALPQPLP